MRRLQGAPTKEYLNGTSRRSNAGRAHKSHSPCGLRQFWAYTALRSLEIPHRVFHRSRVLSKPKIDCNSAHVDLGSSPFKLKNNVLRPRKEIRFLIKNSKEEYLLSNVFYGIESEVKISFQVMIPRNLPRLT